MRDADDAGAFVALPEPLPVGTLVTLKIGDSVRDGRVTDVLESPDSGVAGMRVQFSSAGGASEPAPPHNTGSPAPGGSDGVPQRLAEEGSESVSVGVNGSGAHQGEAGGGGGRRRRRRR